MRFRQLDLLRYGAFADRSFDFGDGGPDLHLIVGPNEAGKSTALQAIGDLLFGIPSQTDQNWRYDYGQLRIRAVIEQDGRRVDLTRRKGNRDTLLKADGTPFAADPLAPLLGGIDRAAFERMFGLDHAKLRQGGESILSGSDDAARITLEAGTGLSHIGAELARLADAASALFKPSGQNPVVNRLMRERSDALTQVRQSTITDSEWTQTRQRRRQAEERRAELIMEADALDREQARLDRIGRARAPLARLAEARRALAALGSLPDLPSDAADRLARARAERATSSELAAQSQTELRRIDAAVAAVVPAGPILALRLPIEALEERRPVIAQAAADLERRSAELDRIGASIAAARVEAGIAMDAALPGAGWRSRVATHLDARRDAVAWEAAAARDLAKAQRERDRTISELSALGEGASPAALAAALALLPSDADARLVEAEREAARKHAYAAELLEQMAPWQGMFAALRAIDPPTAAEAGAVRGEMDAAQSGAAAARRDAEAAEANEIRAQARIDSLTAGGVLPTPELVAAARAARDALVAQIGARLASTRQADDGAAGQSLAEAVQRADLIADRRDAEAARIADHNLAIATRDEARALRAVAERRRTARLEELERLEAGWAIRLNAIGFARPILPADFAGWLTARAAALQADREEQTAAQACADLAAKIGRARVEIARALEEAGGGTAQAEDPRLAERGRQHAAALTELAARRLQLVSAAAAADVSLTELGEGDGLLRETRLRLDRELAQLAGEAGLQRGSDEAGLIDAIAALERVADDVGARDGLVRQVDGIRRDRSDFDEALDVVLAAMGLAREGHAVDQVRGLAARLRAAIRSDEALVGLRDERSRLVVEVERIGRRLANVQATIASLLQSAAAADEDELDRVITACDHRSALRKVERDALGELAGADNGAGLDALAAELAAMSVEDEAAARTRIEDRRREVAAAREEIGRALNAAEEEAERAASGSAAADAQQLATEAAAALAQAAEDHVEAAAAAALLRWVLDRHRATNQAPLIARAGALFAQVTGGAFAGLALGYDRDDTARIQAIRADGTAVGAGALSEGTRDQLYLALRLGAIEGRSVTGALPVICDDLLITADDARAGALLAVLAAAAQHSQVIVFSHHRHLIDIARQAIGADGFRLHLIDPAGLATAA